jgi:heat-inducible transcriptional repressor
MLSERQQEVLRALVGVYLELGRPIGSRALAARPGLPWSASTIRAELAALERAGYLYHPHTSAGRVPTDAGYRFYADSLIESGKLPQGLEPGGLGLTRIQREVEAAMRETTTALSRVTDLMALVTAPPLHTATIHRVEVLPLQPHVVVVLVIDSTGGVTKKVFRFERPVDPGLVEWASSYLNERMAGMGLGARMLADRLADPELEKTESGFLAEISGAFTDLEQNTEETLYIDGAARLLTEARSGDLPHLDELAGTLERRVTLLGMLRSALRERSVFLWIGAENPQPELRSVSVVGANYGLGWRNLGSVGVMGPTRMDYGTAIASVREAAGELSRFFETVYER